MKAPNLRIELTMHPEAKDGDQNAWLLEMFAADGMMVLAHTADNPRACLDVAKEYLETGKVERQRTIRSPFGAQVLRALRH